MSKGRIVERVVATAGVGEFRVVDRSDGRLEMSIVPMVRRAARLVVDAFPVEEEPLAPTRWEAAIHAVTFSRCVPECLRSFAEQVAALADEMERVELARREREEFLADLGLSEG